MCLCLLYLDIIICLLYCPHTNTFCVIQSKSLQSLTYDTPAAEKTLSSSVSLKVANQTLACSTNITYYPDPEFTSFTAIRTGEDVRVTIQVMLCLLKQSTNIWHQLTEGQTSVVVSEKVRQPGDVKRRAISVGRSRQTGTPLYPGGQRDGFIYLSD